jgi:cytidyltransferase-like protein
MTTTVYTGGTFDLYHAGHANFLGACRKIAGMGLVVVGLNTDDFIRQYKGEHPVVPFAARKAVLETVRFVDLVIPNESGADSRPTILSALNGAIRKFIVIGSDWAAKDYYGQMGFTQEWLDNKGITLLYVPYTVGISSTKLRRHIVD